MINRGKRHVFYRMMLRRIIAWMILCLMLSFAFISFFPITALADGEGFNMQFSQTIVYNQEDIWSNGTGSGRHYFAIWEKGPYLFLNNDLIEAEVIHVSKNDYEYVNDRKDQLTEGLGSTDTIEVIEDLTLRPTEAFIEAEGGIYDCGIGTELELLKKELMLLSYQKS